MAQRSSEVLHWPRLDTVLMVEDAIRKARVYPTKSQLWSRLPRRMMYQTLMVILSYLEKSHKILIAKDGKIVWIGGNATLDMAIAKGTKVRPHA